MPTAVSSNGLRQWMFAALLEALCNAKKHI